MHSGQPIVPPQKKGGHSNIHYTVRASNERSAEQLYQNARLNLLNVNSWHSLSGTGAVFQLVNEKGEELTSLVQKGNYFRIHLPGVPGNSAGDGHEWVQVEKIEDKKLRYYEFTAIRVRPAAPPFLDKTETAHFFSSDATSSFCIMRNNKKVTVSVLGRNERPNTQTGNLLTWCRNVLIAVGAMMGLNKPQWKKLAKGIIRKKGAVLRVSM